MFAKHVQLLVTAVLFSFSFVAHPSEFFENFKNISWDETFESYRPVVSLRGGFDYAKVGGETVEHIAFGPGSGNQYKPTEKWHTAGLWGALVGVEIPIYSPGNRWQTGVSYYETGKFQAQGEVWEKGRSNQINLDYEYDVQNLRFLWENKWLTAMNEWFDLYFLAGIGWSQNKATRYQEEPIGLGGNIINPPFGDKTTSSFTYSIGFGMEAAMTEHIRLGIGYQYSDLGKVELDTSPAQTNDEQYKISHTPAQEVLANVTFIY